MFINRIDYGKRGDGRMGKFLLKTLVLVSVLFIGILIGMEKANQGMVQMKGYDDPSLPPPIHVSESADGNIEASVMGKELSHAEELAKKKKELEQLETFNLFSSMGKGLAKIVTDIVDNLVHLVVELI